MTDKITNLFTKRPNSRVTISDDKMEAFLELASPEIDEDYTVESVLELLAKNSVTKGIDLDVIKKIVYKEIYFEKTKVAEGAEVIHGESGYYTFNFSTNIDKKPKLLPDGTVDYHNINIIETVKKDDIVAVYTNSTKGMDGYLVTGQIITAKKGKDLPKLKGKGFHLLEDGITYLSDFDGKVEYTNNRLTISDMFEISGDVDLSTGNINFPGDITITGSVMAGMTVKAVGSITIRQHVESATIIAGKDVIIQNGMQGNYKGNIVAGGNVFAKFLESVNVKAKGSVNANAIMNCSINSYDKVIVAGRFGVIVGCKIHAMKGIEASISGNLSEVKTELNAGINDSYVASVQKARDEIKELEEQIAKIEEGLDKYNIVAAKNPNVSNDIKIQLLRVKVNKNIELSTKTAEYSEMQQLMEEAKDAIIRIDKTVYSGTTIVVNANVMHIKEMLRNSKFFISDGELIRTEQ